METQKKSKFQLGFDFSKPIWSLDFFQVSFWCYMYLIHCMSKHTHTIAFDFVFAFVFQSCGFYNVPRVLITDARSFQALATILDYVPYLASISCRYRSDTRQDEFWVSQTTLLWISKVRGYDHVCSRWNRNPSYKSRKTHRRHFPNLWLLLVS